MRYLFKPLLVLVFIFSAQSFTTIQNQGLNFHPTQRNSYSTNPNGESRTHCKHDVLTSWKAGEIVTQQQIDAFGIDKCFIQLPIDEILFKRIYKKSYKANCPIPINELRYLKVLHVDIDKNIRLGELICHQDISNDLLAIFKILFKACYPIERMVLIDDYNAEDEPSMQANNTSCFNFRNISGTNNLSNHSTGHAIDINPLYNPYVKNKKGKIIYQPKTAGKYINRLNNFPYKITKGDLCYKLFKKHGFKWGGEWKNVKDFQHFEKGN